METDVLSAAALSDAARDKIVDQVWEETDTDHNTGGTMGGLQNVTAPTVGDIADQVWLENLGDHSGAGTNAAKHLEDLTVDLIADQVWEEQIGEHSGTGGSTAEALNAAGGGLTAEAVADAVWDEALGDHHGGGSAGRALAITKGLVQGHHRLKNPTYDPNGRLLTAELVVYPTALDATNDTNADFTFNVTCTYDGDGNLLSLLSTE
jgi:hypothetical protein